MYDESFVKDCEELLEDASIAIEGCLPYQAEQALIKLRKLLDDQPELEAGGTVQNPKQKENHK